MRVGVIVIRTHFAPARRMQVENALTVGICAILACTRCERNYSIECVCIIVDQLFDLF